MNALKELTLEEQATNYVTMRHIEEVRNNLNKIAMELLRRGELHDQSKLVSPEVELFTEWTPKLAQSTFGSPEYEGFRKAMGPALAHHYAKNRHHPEHFTNGIEDMNLLDIVEMFCDWYAATKRHHDGNLRKSIKTNADRFKMSPQLVSILDNSVELFDV